MNKESESESKPLSQTRGYIYISYYLRFRLVQYNLPQNAASDEARKYYKVQSYRIFLLFLTEVTKQPGYRINGAATRRSYSDTLKLPPAIRKNDFHWFKGVQLSNQKIRTVS